MERFKFALEHVLKYRQNLEDQEKISLAKAMQRVRQEEGAARQLHEEKYRSISSFDIRVADLMYMRQHESYMSLLDLRIQNQQKQLAKAEKACNTARVRVVDAASKRKVLERLKDKQWAEYQQEQLKAEQKVLDEVGISAYSRKESW